MDSYAEMATADIIDGLVEKGFMFTSWDITKLVRKAGYKAFHSEVKAIVGQKFRDGEMDDYIRQTIDVSAAVKPFIYMNPNSNPDYYDRCWVDNNFDRQIDSGVQDTVTIDSSVKTIDNGPTKVDFGFNTQDDSQNPNSPNNVDDGDKTNNCSERKLYGYKSLTSEKRLEIPNFFNSSFAAGNVMVVEKEPDSIILRPPVFGEQPTVNYIGKINVDSKGRLRVCNSILKEIAGHSNRFIISYIKDPSQLATKIIIRRD